MLSRHVISGTILSLVLAGSAGSLAREGSALDRLKNADQPITLNFKDADVSGILDLAAKAGAFKLTLSASFRDSRVTLPEEKTTLKGFLARLADAGGLTYSVPDPEELVVGMKSP